MNKIWVYITVFITGGVIMFLELIGTRVISPYYGNTLYTWTSLISTALISLALGYYLGGRLADNKKNFETMYTLIFLAGIFIVLIPKISFLVLTSTNFLGIRFGSLAASLILFSIPLTLLAMVVPYALKLDLKKIDNVGVTSGKLYAISTIGSLMGTILTGFYFIPNLRISFSITLIGFILIIASLSYFFNIRRKRKLTLVLLMLLLPTLNSAEPVYTASSFYGTIKVIDKGDLRYLLVDGSSQGCIYKSNDESCFGYVHELADYFEEEDRILLIGLGVGSLAKKVDMEDIIEIDPMIVETAETYFGFDEDVIIDDGRNFLRDTEKEYDKIILDAFSGYSIASHLLSVEAFREAKDKLVPGGTLIVNTLGTDESSLQNMLYPTLKEVFQEVQVVKIGVGLPNYVFFASDNRTIMDEGLDFSDGMIITDDYNPIEFKSQGIYERWRELNIEWFGDDVI